ncbi:GMP/IMP nucleotidase [Neptunomonas phycophila]
MIVPAMLDWSSIDTVLLDMDGTLLDLHFDSHFWLEHLPLRYAELHQLDPVEVRTWLHQRIMQEHGTLNWYCLDYWSQELQVDIVALKREITDRISFRPHVQDFLAAVQNAGMRSVIITNAHRGSLDLKLEHTDLGDRVDRIISSHDFQEPKEKAEFWDCLQDIEPFDPHHTLFIDDSLPVLRSAQRYGIRYLLSILKPDSQGEEKPNNEFMILDEFSEIIPKGVNRNV